jgi:hypothetical protein
VEGALVNETVKDVVTCGAHFCEDLLAEIDNLKRPDEWKIQIMMSIFVGFTVSATIPVVLFLDPLSRSTAYCSEFGHHRAQIAGGLLA